MNSKNFSGKALDITVKGSDGTTLNLEPVDFVWNVPALNLNPSSAPSYRNGQKGAIVELFGWPYADIMKECKFIADAGYLGIKLYPHQEQVMASEPFKTL